MSDIKWVKLHTDILSNRKIKYIRSMPQGDELCLLWVLMLATAGVVNDRGKLYISDRIPYNVETLANELSFPHNTVKLGLELFERLNMISFNGSGTIIIKNWEEYQSVQGMEKVRELTRERVRKYRDKQKELDPGSDSNGSNVTGNATGNVTETHGNAPRIENLDLKNLDLKNQDLKDSTHAHPSKTPYKEIVDLFNSTCISLPTVQEPDEWKTATRKDRLRKLWKQESDLEAWKHLFERIERSDFLAGRTEKWTGATFDWILKPANLQKIIEGNYDNKGDREDKLRAAAVARFLEGDDE